MTLLVAGLGLLGVSFAVSAVLCILVRRVAPRFGLIDAPGGRKAHRAPTPLGGGVAIWLTTVLVLALGAAALWLGQSQFPPELAQHIGGLWERSGELVWIMSLASAVMVMGLCDDRWGLDWKLRLGVQLGLSTLLVISGVRLTLYPPFASRDPTSALVIGWTILTGGLTVLWIVGLTNAFNFLDNMDGLAASVGLIAALLFAGAQLAVRSLFVPAVLLVVVGALAGFLVHNRYPARLFMGDAGSNFLGFLLGSLTVAGTFSRPEYSHYSVLAPLLVMAVPLYDTCSVVLIRLREGRSPFQADRRHFSHRLVERGLTPPRAVWTIDLVTLASGLGALLLHRASAQAACVILAQTVCLLGVVALLEVSTTPSERRNGEAPRSEPSTSDAATPGQRT
ncbi:MAG TPA: MraY family glycosyltransferase [Isosphaeraceae bacterium]|nr:MraY family glycosyltransferase [Isosphaeraceae bacterium]